MAEKGTTLPDDAEDNSLVLSEGSADAQDNSLVLLRRRFLREAIEQTAWPHEALITAMKARGVPVDGPYLSKMLSGDKPITLKHLDALPADVGAVYYRLQAEHFGFIVVEPVDEATARRHLVSGLVGVLTGRTGLRMARAGVISQKKARTA